MAPGISSFCGVFLYTYTPPPTINKTTIVINKRNNFFEAFIDIKLYPNKRDLLAYLTT